MNKNKSSPTIFVVLSSISLIIIALFAVLLWKYEISGRLHEITQTWVINIIIALLWTLCLYIIFSIIVLCIECYTKLTVNYFRKVIRLSITFIFPFNILIGKMLFIQKDNLRESFVSVNNSFFKTNKEKHSANKILLLLPHCLQNYECNLRITNNIYNCTDCGKCIITEIKKLSTKYKVKVAIATGGTLARKIIGQTKPKFIIAVACHRDLVEGLLDVFPIKVYGILINHPHGPCINTTVNISNIENILYRLII